MFVLIKLEDTLQKFLINYKLFIIIIIIILFAKSIVSESKFN